MTSRSSELYYRLKGLGVGSTVLQVGAHPDDEEVGLLSYLTHRYGIKVVYWSATRGEGGQNKIGPHTGDALGLYRTWESERVREADGASCLYGPFVDFGYSKHAEEGFEKWGRERLIKEIVRAIRICQPHLVINRWTGTDVDGHGQHESIGQVCEEAFEAAGDPNRFPELREEGLPAWRPLKLYLSEMRVGHLTPEAAKLFGARREDLERPGVVRIDTGEFDPVAGETYQERAWKAYNLHQSQAMGWLPKPGRFYYYFSLLNSIVSDHATDRSFFDGFDPNLVGILPVDCEATTRRDLETRLETVKAHLDDALASYRFDEPSQALAPLLRAHEEFEAVRTAVGGAKALSPDERGALERYLDTKISDLEEVAASCLQLQFEPLGPHPRATPGSTIPIQTRLWNHGDSRLDGVDFDLDLPVGWRFDTSDEGAAGDGEEAALHWSRSYEIRVASDAKLDCPYWLAEPRELPYVFKWPQGEPAGRPLGPDPVTAECRVRVGGRTLTLRRQLQCREAFPGGFRELGVQVVAPISMAPESSMKLLAPSDIDQEQTLRIRLENNGYEPVTGELMLTTPAGWSVSPSRASVVFESRGGSQTLAFSVRIPAGASAGDYDISANLLCDDRGYDVFAEPVRIVVPGVPTVTADNCAHEANMLSPSRVPFRVVDVAFADDLRYAYIEGAAQTITDTLEPFGVKIQKLSDREIETLDLAQFDAIVVGQNAYLMRDALRKNAERLLEYTRAGGTLIVEFQGYGYAGHGFTPYPFEYSVPRDRVVHEEAPVTVLNPSHFIFRFPNSIVDADFDDWVSERGLYFFGKWDSRYTPLLSCADAGEEQKKGGFLITHYGHGTYVYNAYAFFRQIPAGNPGALRLFANLLALPEARIRERMDILREVDIFRPLEEVELRAVARKVAESWIDKGHILCTHGEQGDTLFVIDSGELEIVSEAGEVIYRAQPGECVGELAVLCDIPRTATIRASCPTEVFELRQGLVHELLDRYPMMARRFIDVLVQRLYKSGLRQ